MINSPPSRVWRVIEKHLQHPELESGRNEPGAIQELGGEVLSEQRAGVGTRTRWSYNYNGRRFAWDDLVTEWVPEKRIVWKATSGWKMEDSFTLQKEEAGTRLVYDMSYHLPYGPLGWLYGKLILEPRMRQHLSNVLQRTKKLSENPLG
jgi:uncharacterized membrane protein